MFEAMRAYVKIHLRLVNSHCSYLSDSYSALFWFSYDSYMTFHTVSHFEWIKKHENHLQTYDSKNVPLIMVEFFEMTSLCMV